MMRSSDQAKLLFLYLLRTSSALATRASSTAASVGMTSTTITTNTHTNPANPTTATTTSSKPFSSFTSPNLEGYINLRLATRLDVPSIQRCNLATLPENYSSNFYVNHLRNFPELALVAEHIPPGGNPQSNSSLLSSSPIARKNPFDTYTPSSVPENKIIGYVLGKIELDEKEEQILDRNGLPQLLPPLHPLSSSPSSSKVATTTGDDELDDYLSYQYQQQKQKQKRQKQVLGHVTSLAVLKPYRRKGLAALLMKQLHFHMRYGYHATDVGLHVRVSNVAAKRLYCEGMGYGVVDVIKNYYADGEDAFFMKKDLSLLDNEYYSYLDDSSSGSQEQKSRKKKNLLGSRWSLGRKNNNENGVNRSALYLNGPLEFRLPMMIPLNEEENVNDNVPGMIDDSSEDEESRVMTGSL